LIPVQQIYVSHDGSTEDLSGINLGVDVWLRENKGSNANITPLNLDAATYLNDIEYDDKVFIRLKRDAADSYTKVFGGYAVELTPEGSINGLKLPVKCYGFETAFDCMRVTKEYGANSTRSDLLTIYDVLTDNTGGILPKYLGYVLGSALASGYACETTYLYEDTTDFLPYTLFPCTPINDALKTLLDLYTASTGEALHWTVTQPATDIATFQFCLDKVNDHTTAATRWPTACPIAATAGENILSATYGKQQMEANYILYYGKYQYPVDESLTETAATNWTEEGGVDEDFWEIEDDAVDPKIGSNSLKLTQIGAGVLDVFSHSLPSLDTDKFSTRRTPASIGFYLKQTLTGTLKIMLGTGTYTYGGGSNSYFLYDFTSQIPKSGVWGYATADLGNSWRDNGWTSTGTPDWSDLDYILIHQEDSNTGTHTLNIDGLAINGIITRAAYEDSAARYKIKPVTDSLAVSANITASDDSGTVAQLAKAEYLRAKSTPTTGNIILTGLYPTILPGQILSTANYRITEVHFHMANDNVFTELTTTDDLTNSYPAENTTFGPTAQYNAIMRAVNPDFQDRDRGTLKAREIDVEQTVLAKAYT
jgi:hypothetical protein